MRVSLNNNFGMKNYYYVNRMNSANHDANYSRIPTVNFGDDDLREWAMQQAEEDEEYIRGIPTERLKVTDLICHGVGMGVAPLSIRKYQSEILKNPCEPEKYLDGLIDSVAHYRKDFLEGQSKDDPFSDKVEFFGVFAAKKVYRDSIVWKLNKMFKVESSPELKKSMRSFCMPDSKLSTESMIIMLPYYEDYLKKTGQLKNGISFKYIQDFYQFKHNVNNTGEVSVKGVKKITEDFKKHYNSLPANIQEKYKEDFETFIDDLIAKNASGAISATT